MVISYCLNDTMNWMKHKKSDVEIFSVALLLIVIHVSDISFYSSTVYNIVCTQLYVLEFEDMKLIFPTVNDASRTV